MARTPEDFIATIPEPKQSEIRALHELIRKAAPRFEPSVSGTMIGYGPYHYRYPSGREGDSHRVALSANKTGISMYVTAVDAGGWLAEQAKDELGRVTVGKSCVRMKRLSDVNLPALTALLKRAAKTAPPGAVSEGTAKPAKSTGAAKPKRTR